MTNATEDLLMFDGSAEPNPGGRMGWGWRIVWADGHTTDGSGEQAPHPSNTVNVAEYNGLIAGLTAYRAADGRGPLRVQGDSQLIVYQMIGRYSVSKPALQALHAQARALVAAIPGPVDLHWVRRELNAVADRLAGGETADAPPATRTCLVSVAQAPIAPTLRTAIQRLNTHPGPGFGDLAKLRVGGTDTLSALSLPVLLERAGIAAAQAVAKAFPDQPTEQAAVLRWALRGLALELALQKGKVDTEIRGMAERKAARSGGRGAGR